MSFEEWTRKIIRHVNKGDTYFKEREFPEFDEMHLVYGTLITERRKLVVGYIDDMEQRVVNNNWVWKRETLKYLFKYIPLKQMQNISFSY